MFIQTSPTPNPMTLKFIPGVDVLGNGTRFYTSQKAAKGESPLAESLFEIEGVNAVFLGGDFITVTKAAELEWTILKADILTKIMDHFVAGNPVIIEQKKEQAAKSPDDANDSDVVRQIKELIETRVRPAVAQDGGDIVFHSYDDGIVRLEMHGACQGCPSSTITLKNGIENMLRHYIPEVEGVEAVA